MNFCRRHSERSEAKRNEVEESREISFKVTPRDPSHHGGQAVSRGMKGMAL